MAFSTVNYSEPKQSTYRSISLRHVIKGVEQETLFDTGNAVIDHYNYMLFLQNQDEEWYKRNARISGSSSWDHFFMDGKKYRESYFNPETGEFINWRKALDDGDYETFNKCCENEYPKVIHLPCHKSFLSVKKYYKQKTKNRVVVLPKNA